MIFKGPFPLRPFCDLLGMVFYGVEYPSGKLGSAVRAMLSPGSFLHLFPGRAWQTGEFFRVALFTNNQNMSVLLKLNLILNSKHSTVPNTKKKINYASQNQDR